MAAGRSHVYVQITSLAVIDLICLITGSVIGVVVRLGHEEVREYVFLHLEGWLLLVGSVILANHLAGSYRIQYTFSRFNLIVKWAFSLFFALLILSITSYAWFTVLLGRGVLVISLSLYSFLALTLKLLVYRKLFRSEAFQCRAAILGTGKRARRLRAMIENKAVLPAHRTVAFVDVDGGREQAEKDDGFLDGVVVFDCDRGALEDIVRSLDVKLMVIGLEDMSELAQFYSQLRRLRFEGIEILTPLQVSEIYNGSTPLDQVSEELLMQVGMESSLPLISREKRLFDIVIGVLASVILMPFALVITAVVKFSAPRSPVMYTQLRIGHFGRRFRILKFRTMREGAEAETGPVWATAGDSRITLVGRILRRFRVDEIPQFINVLRGDMSIVGPRPERPELAAELAKKIPYYAERENVMPGLTGWAQVRYPYGSSVEDAARKLEYDLYYIKHFSLRLDLQILLSTLRIILFSKERSV